MLHFGFSIGAARGVTGGMYWKGGKHICCAFLPLININGRIPAESQATRGSVSLSEVLVVVEEGCSS